MSSYLFIACEYELATLYSPKLHKLSVFHKILKLLQGNFEFFASKINNF